MDLIIITNKAILYPNLDCIDRNKALDGKDFQLYPLELGGGWILYVCYFRAQGFYVNKQRGG